jgi:hypothetical protein
LQSIAAKAERKTHDVYRPTPAGREISRHRLIDVNGPIPKTGSIQTSLPNLEVVSWSV